MTYILEITPPHITFPNDSILIKHTRTSPFTAPPAAWLDIPCNAQHKLQQLSTAGGERSLKALESFSRAHTLLKVAHEKGTVSYLNMKEKKKKAALRRLLAEEKTTVFCFGGFF